MPLQPAIAKYLADIVQLRTSCGAPLVSVVLFGSAARGAFTAEISDVDLLLVVPDNTSAVECREFAGRVAALEVAHGFRAQLPRVNGILERYLERWTGHLQSAFVCSRSDLLSGDAARILGLSRFEAAFVDRIVLPGIVTSAVTVWGEDVLPQVRVPPVRRLDVCKALFNFSNALLLCATVYPFMSDATRYAMSILKHSLHSCYFCYRHTAASIEEEASFFRSRMRSGAALDEVLLLRKNYKPSFAFILRCFGALVFLHLRTLQDNHFPQSIP